MITEPLAAELERLLSQNELGDLARASLGLSPERLGDASSKAVFARALVQRCVAREALGALFDAFEASGKRLSPALQELKNDGLSLEPPLGPGSELGEFLLLEELGSSASARIYRARRGDEELRVRVLHTALRRRDAERALTQARLCAMVAHPALPERVNAAALDSAGLVLGVSSQFVSGETLAQQLVLLGARHTKQVLPLLWAIAEPLAALHAEGRTHGALHPGNVLVIDASEAMPRVLLLDAGAGHARPPFSDPGQQRFVRALAPELVRGAPSTPESDVYAFGALMYELIAGKPPFDGRSSSDIALSHLSSAPEPLSFSAPGNGATPAVETLVRALLDPDPAQRPQSGGELLELVRKLWRNSQRPPSFVADERLPELFTSLAEAPDDEEAAAHLESLQDLGADPARLAHGFFELAKKLRIRDEAGTRRAVPRLLGRAARLYEKAARPEAAEKLYEGLLKLNPEDRTSERSLDKVRRTLGKYEELVESLLLRSERSTSGTRRAEYLFAIGEVYASELGDTEQALVAFARAFSADPSQREYADRLERLAGTRFQAWEEVFDLCIEAADDGELPSEARQDLFSHLARWYTDKVSRPDLALPWLHRVLELEPSHERSLEALCQNHRRAQQWPELVQALGRRADAAAPNVSRELRAEAAEVLANKLGDTRAAYDSYEALTKEDPGHLRAVNGFVELLQQAGEAKRALSLRRALADSLSGDEKVDLLCEVAQAFEVEFDDLAAAERAYAAAVAENPRAENALRGLDRIYGRQGRYRELYEVLSRELEITSTARQKVTLLERMAGVCDEEFLDHTLAAQALEQVLALDPGRMDAAVDLGRHYRALDRFTDLAELYQRQVDRNDDEAVRLRAALALGRLLCTELQAPERALEVYEFALALEPGNETALDALADLRSAAGDSANALSAIEELARAAEQPRQRAEQHQRAATLLERRGDLDGVITQLKRAIDADPRDESARNKLKEKYLGLGNYAGVVELLDEQIGHISGERSRAQLAGEIALLCQRRLGDAERASAMAELAVRLDPSELSALQVLGRFAFEEGRFADAAKRLEPVVSSLEGRTADEASEVARSYVEALLAAGAEEKAWASLATLRRYFVDSPRSVLAIAELCKKHGGHEQALPLLEDLLGRPASNLELAERAEAERLRGQLLLELGSYDEAVEAFESSLTSEPGQLSALDGIANAFSALALYDRALETLYRKLEHTNGEARSKLLLEIGDLASSKLNNADYAAQSYLLALAERPNDRDILAKLMQLYGSERDWPKLIQVITKLAEVVADAKHKAKYLHTASMIASRELGDGELASKLLLRALDFDPSLESALDEVIQLRQQARDWEELKNLLKLRIRQAQAAGQKARLLATLWQLADVYEKQFQRPEQAIAVVHSARELEPENVRWSERLARLYSADPAGSFADAVPLIGEWIEREPEEGEPYRLLRRIYTGVRHADGAFSACQALHVLGQAEPDEERFYNRLRSDEPQPVVDRLNLGDWPEYLLPSDHDSAVSALMVLLEPMVLAARAQSLDTFGLTPEHVLDATAYPYGLVYALHYASQVLGVAEPPVLQNQEDPGVLTFLPTAPPCIALGAGAFAAELPAVTTYFLAGRSLSYFIPGFFLRQVLSNMTALKSWVFAAIRLVQPKFPVVSELSPLVLSASRELGRDSGSPRQREQLTCAVSRLLRGTELLDLKRWSHAVDYTADRAGLVMCQDLDSALVLMRNLPAEEGAPALEARVQRLITYSVSTTYLTLRERLGLGPAA